MTVMTVMNLTPISCDGRPAWVTLTAVLVGLEAVGQARCAGLQLLMCQSINMECLQAASSGYHAQWDGWSWAGCVLPLSKAAWGVVSYCRLCTTALYVHCWHMASVCISLFVSDKQSLSCLS